MTEVLAAAIVALLVGAVIGWLAAGRSAAAFKAERDLHSDKFKAAVTDLAAVVHERDDARDKLARAETDASNFEARLIELRDAKDALSAQFAEVGGKLLGEAQEAFLKRAEDRFRQSEETSGAALKSLLLPVNERLQKYEETVGKVEAERREAFGMLHGQIESMRAGTERVSSEAAKLVNALRNAPKARGRWGEQQLRNVLESCGLSEHCDFAVEVSVDGGEAGRLRPDVIVKVPGGRSLVIDAKVSLNAYQDAFGAVDESERAAHLSAHVVSMRTHINGLGAKAYQAQFEDTPDFVIMFVPGEHFLAAALEHDPDLWDFAFGKKVLLATPTNLVAIAKTVASIWRQEKLAKEARQIGELGKELYDRLAKVSDDLGRAGTSLNRAVGQFNEATGSFNRNLVSTGKKFRDLNIETGKRELDDVAPIEALASHADADNVVALASGAAKRGDAG